MKKEKLTNQPYVADLLLCGIDVGFDLRAHDIAVELPQGATSACFEERGEVWRVEGTQKELAQALRDAGFRVKRPPLSEENFSERMIELAAARSNPQASVSPYLMFADNMVVTLIAMPKRTPADYYGQVQEDFSLKAGVPPIGKYGKSYATMCSLWSENMTPQGIAYESELAGPGGAAYRLLVPPGVDQATVEQSKAFIRHSFDAVRLSVLRFKRVINYTLPVPKVALAGSLSIPRPEIGEEAGEGEEGMRL